MLAFLQQLLFTFPPITFSLESLSTLIVGLFYYAIIIFILRFFTSKTFLTHLSESDMSGQRRTISIQGIEMPANATFKQIELALEQRQRQQEAERAYQLNVESTRRYRDPRISWPDKRESQFPHSPYKTGFWPVKPVTPTATSPRHRQTSASAPANTIQPKAATTSKVKADAPHIGQGPKKPSDEHSQFNATAISSLAPDTNGNETRVNSDEYETRKITRIHWNFSKNPPPRPPFDLKKRRVPDHTPIDYNYSRAGHGVRVPSASSVTFAPELAKNNNSRAGGDSSSSESPAADRPTDKSPPEGVKATQTTPENRSDRNRVAASRSHEKSELKGKTSVRSAFDASNSVPTSVVPVKQTPTTPINHITRVPPLSFSPTSPNHVLLRTPQQPTISGDENYAKKLPFTNTLGLVFNGAPSNPRNIYNGPLTRKSYRPDMGALAARQKTLLDASDQIHTTSEDRRSKAGPSSLSEISSAHSNQTLPAMHAQPMRMVDKSVSTEPVTEIPAINSATLREILNTEMRQVMKEDMRQVVKEAMGEFLTGGLQAEIHRAVGVGMSHLTRKVERAVVRKMKISEKIKDDVRKVRKQKLTQRAKSPSASDLLTASSLDWLNTSYEQTNATIYNPVRPAAMNHNIAANTVYSAAPSFPWIHTKQDQANTLSPSTVTRPEFNYPSPVTTVGSATPSFDWIHLPNSQVNQIIPNRTTPSHAYNVPAPFIKPVQPTSDWHHVWNEQSSLADFTPIRPSEATHLFPVFSTPTDMPALDMYEPGFGQPHGAESDQMNVEGLENDFIWDETMEIERLLDPLSEMEMDRGFQFEQDDVAMATENQFQAQGSSAIPWTQTPAQYFDPDWFTQLPVVSAPAPSPTVISALTHGSSQYVPVPEPAITTPASAGTVGTASITTPATPFQGFAFPVPPPPAIVPATAASVPVTNNAPVVSIPSPPASPPAAFNVSPHPTARASSVTTVVSPPIAVTPAIRSTPPTTPLRTFVKRPRLSLSVSHSNPSAVESVAEQATPDPPAESTSTEPNTSVVPEQQVTPASESTGPLLAENPTPAPLSPPATQNVTLTVPGPAIATSETASATQPSESVAMPPSLQVISVSPSTSSDPGPSVTDTAAAATASHTPAPADVSISSQAHHDPQAFNFSMPRPAAVGENPPRAIEAATPVSQASQGFIFSLPGPSRTSTEAAGPSNSAGPSSQGFTFSIPRSSATTTESAGPSSQNSILSAPTPLNFNFSFSDSATAGPSALSNTMPAGPPRRFIFGAGPTDEELAMNEPSELDEKGEVEAMLGDVLEGDEGGQGSSSSFIANPPSLFTSSPLPTRSAEEAQVQSALGGYTDPIPNANSAKQKVMERLLAQDEPKPPRQHGVFVENPPEPASKRGYKPWVSSKLAGSPISGKRRKP
ncbi:hypothetical protein CI109_107237 [Kwoniella shandongensis]|uniref:Uncharacterized protein n=1 Tax=Kwoniella shandongensis TaxID=1734106 RepID=A0A5M6C7J8_9TREE|nr:uncharacterized protein CI109_002520 [Kwoniella shandongensis]KAA5529179.1 hypothetical protein CI109_002520 [Kwoniella shandongensis]